MNGEIITKFKEKANLFNKYFLSQFNSLQNGRKLQENQTYITETKLSSFNIETEYIYKITKALYINETHAHNEISIRMLKLCDGSIVKPLDIIFNNCKFKKTFPSLWKKANVVPVHKKGEKDPIRNYRPVLFYQYLVKFLKD